MANTRAGATSLGRNSMAMGSNDPRNHRNPQNQQFTQNLYELPIGVDNNGRIALVNANSIAGLSDDATNEEVIDTVNQIIRFLNGSTS